MVALVLVLGAILSIIHYFSEKYSSKIEKFHDELVSFSSGLFITLLFVFFLPEFFQGQEFLGDNIYLLLVLGFVSFHVAEKYIYQHVKNRDEMIKDLSEVHAFGFFIDHFVVGMALVFAFQTPSILFGFSVFIVLVLHTMSSSISLTHIDEYFKQNKIVNIILALAPLGGVIFASLLNPEKSLYYIIFSLVIGALFYVGIRDLIPSKDEGRVSYFAFGFIISIIITYLIQFLAT
ncbi:hypothetical protein IIC68_01295 [archaeon]|nr:hypothetical protein [archaeon]